MRFRKPQRLPQRLLVITSAVLVGGYFAIAWWLSDGLWIFCLESHWRLARLHGGMESVEIRSILGEPAYRLDENQASEIKEVKGYPVPDRPVEEELWIYFMGIDLAVFVYFSPEMKVDEVIIRGS